MLLYVKNRFNLNRGFYFELNLHHRFHQDRFNLLRNQPDIYTNVHKTRKSGIDFHAYKDMNSAITLVSGGSFHFDAIHSRGIREGSWTWALGKHERINQSFFTEGRFRSNHMILNAGYRFDFNSFHGYINSPSVDAGYFFNANFKFKIAYSQSYRAPDYTELYYSDERSNFGNENLTAEKSQNYEAGFDYFDKRTKISFLFFYMDQANLIDWAAVEHENGIIFQTRNFNHIQNSGVEFKFFQKIRRRSISIFYQYLNVTNLQRERKYLTAFTKYYINLWGNFRISRKATAGIKFQMRNRMAMPSYHTVDLKFAWKLPLQRHFQFDFSIYNTFNQCYENIPGIKAPGRWISGGMTIQY